MARRLNHNSAGKGREYKISLIRNADAARPAAPANLATRGNVARFQWRCMRQGSDSRAAPR